MASLDDLVGVLKAAGEQTRLRLLALLAKGDLSVKDLTVILNQSQPRISRHLKLLFEAGLVERLPEGAWVYYRLASEGANRTLVDGLLAQLDRVDPVLNRDQDKLAQVKEANAQLASDYFQKNAEHWEDLRALHVPDSAVNEAILSCLGQTPIHKLLDLGTGTGSILTLLADRCEQGLGIDANRSMLSIARSRLDGPDYTHLKVQQGDILDLTTHQGQYDLVTLHQVLHYHDDPFVAIDEAAHVVAPHGRLLIVDFAPHEHEFLRREHAHRRLGFSHMAMERWLRKAGFDVQAVRDLAAAPRQGAAKGAGNETSLTVTVWMAKKNALSG